MATVPTYGGPRVRSDPLRAVQAQSPDVSSGLRAAAGAIATVGEEFDKIALRDDQTAAFDAHAKLQADWMAADQDLRGRFRGAHADQYKAEAEKWWADAPAKYGEGLSPRGAQIARTAVQQTRAQALAGAQRFWGAEKERAADMAAESAKGTEIQFAMTDGSAEAIAVSERKIAGINAALAARRGLDADTLQLMNLKDMSDMHAGRVEALLQQDPVAAQSYFDTNKVKIAPGAQKALAGRLESAGNLVKAQAVADDVTTRFADDMAGGMRWIEENMSGEQEKIAKAEAMQRYSYREAAARDAQERAYGQAQLEVERGGRVSAATFAGLTPGHKAAILNRQQAEARARAADAAGRPPKTDWALYADLRMRAAAGEKIDVRQYVDKLAGGQVEQLLDIQTRAAKPEKAPEVASTEQQMSIALAASGIKGENAGQFRARVMDELAGMARTTGKEPGYDDRQKVIDRMLLQDDGGWFGGTKRLYQVPRGAEFNPQVPEADRAMIEKALIAEGKKPTDAEITKRFKLKQGIQ